MQTEKNKYLFGVCKVGEKGQIVIPKEAREVFNIKSGDSLLLLGDTKKGLALVKTDVFNAIAEETFKDD
ncbi:MAG: AbrB/MazE/SpoVT family DNA-binding domain-containing protein [Clostridia bacterium]|nr:AbrB/MazE/SpoVT family DNA-binding domain-containing protein [Clostridia bacterium]